MITETRTPPPSLGTKRTEAATKKAPKAPPVQYHQGAAAMVCPRGREMRNTSR